MTLIPYHVKYEVENALRIMNTNITPYQLNSTLYRVIGYLECALTMKAITNEQCTNMQEILFKKWEWCHLNMTK